MYGVYAYRSGGGLRGSLEGFLGGVSYREIFFLRG